MRTIVKSLAIAPFLFLLGCAETQYWVHNSKMEQAEMEQAFYQDNSECLALASGSVSNTQIIPTTGSPGFATGFAKGWNQGAAARATQDRQTIYKHCLMGRGWRPQQAQ